jgi:replicative DNA helicase
MSTKASRVLPYNLEAEQSVVACVLFDNHTITTAAAILSPDDFYNDQYRIIYNAMLYLYSKDMPIDIITLSDRLRNQEMLNALGGIEFLTSLVDILSSAENMEQYCMIVKDKSMHRQLISKLSKVIDDSYSNKAEAKDLILSTEKDILDIVVTRDRKFFVPFDTALKTTLLKLQETTASGSNITGIPTGFIDLDKKTSGLQDSDLIILAGRPGMGKTSLGINICQHAAIREHKKVAVFSLEMPLEQLTMRIIASEANISSMDLRTGSIKDWSKIYKVWEEILSAKLFIDDTPGITVNEIRSKCRRLKAQEELDLILIDYLQLIRSVGRIENRQQEISQISRDLKLLAKELSCPVVTLSQLNRSPEKRTDNKPLISDLRESGAIEQDADIVLFLYKTEVDNAISDKVTLSIAKHRNGPTGDIDLVFQEETTTFKNASSYDFDNE